MKLSSSDTSQTTARFVLTGSSTNVLTVWVIFAAFVLVLGACAIYYSVQSEVRNDLDATILAMLAENVTYLDMVELINAHNITLLAQNITWAELRILLLEGRLAAVQGSVMAMQLSVTTIQFVVIPQLYANLTNIYNNITYGNGNLTQVSLLLANVTDALITFNTSLYTVVLFGLDTISAVPPIASNVNLQGTCGLNVSVGTLPGTVIIDGCQFEVQLVNLTNQLYATALQLFATVNMSNTTLNTLNGQHPIAGQVFVVAQGAGIAVTPGNASNAVTIENTGVVSLNGKQGVNSIAAGRAMYAVPNGTNGLEIGYAGPNTSYVDTLTGTLGIVNPDGLPGNTYSVKVDTNMSAYGTLNSNASPVCMYASSMVGNTSVFPFSIYAGGPLLTTSYANLVPCNTPCATCFVTKTCMYDETPAPGLGGCFHLFQRYAVYKIDIAVTLYAIFPSDSFFNYNPSSRIELQYCMYGPAGCSTLNSPNWKRVTQPEQNAASGYPYIVFTEWTVSASIIEASSANDFSQVMFRLYCRCSADSFGSFATSVIPCFQGNPAPLQLPTVSVKMMITRVA